MPIGREVTSVEVSHYEAGTTRSVRGRTPKTPAKLAASFELGPHLKVEYHSLNDLYD